MVFSNKIKAFTAEEKEAAEDAMWEEMEEALTKALSPYGYKAKLNRSRRDKDVIINGNSYPVVDESSHDETANYHHSLHVDVNGQDVELEFIFDKALVEQDRRRVPTKLVEKNLRQLLTALLYVKANFSSRVEAKYAVTEILVEAAEYQGKKVPLNKPMRGDVKKYKVYVKNDKGNVVKVNFGDSEMEIKRDDLQRRKSFRARHKCDTDPGPKWKARYWSCRFWDTTPVSELLKK